MKITLKILRIIVATGAWLFMLYPVYFTFRGLFTTNFTFLSIEFIRGLEVYLILFLIFFIVALILLLINIIIGSFKKRREIDYETAQQNFKKVTDVYNKTYKTLSFKDTNYINIDPNVNDEELNQVLDEIHGGK